MAEGNIASCPICFEDYSDSTDTIPRILPCHHTQCTNCTVKLIKSGKLTCPSCKAIHDAPRKEKTFPENSYIVAFLHERRRTVQRITRKVCAEHGKKLTLFCKDEQKVICATCLSRSHKRHDVIEIEEIEEEEKAQLVKRVNTLTKILKTKRSKLETARSHLSSKSYACLDSLHQTKMEIIQKFNEIVWKYDRMIQTVAESNDKKLEDIDNFWGTIDVIIATAQSLLEHYASPLELASRIETITELEQNIDRSLSGVQRFELYQHIYTALSIDPIVGYLSKEHMRVDLTHGAKMSDIKGKVEKTFQVPLHGFYNMGMSDDSTVFIIGIENNQFKLKRLNLQTGAEQDSVDLGSVPMGPVVMNFKRTGLAVLEVGGRKIIAVSSPSQGMIEIRDINNLKSVLYTHQLALHQPSRLCVSSPSTLLYADRSKSPREVHIRDCTGAEPKPVNGKNVIKTQLKGLSDMCVARDGDRELLICAGFSDQVKLLAAYNMRTGGVEWRAEGKLDRMQEFMKPTDVTTDGRGHLFVADNNNMCIQMFHVADGRYMGVLDVGCEEGIGIPAFTLWCEAMSSLVVLCDKYPQVVINVISITHD